VLLDRLRHARDIIDRDRTTRAAMATTGIIDSSRWPAGLEAMDQPSLIQHTR